LIGAVILCTMGISIIFAFIIFLFSFFIDDIFKTQVKNTLRIISVFTGAYPIQYMLLELCQGANKIRNLALFNIIPKIFYLSGCFIIIYFFRLGVLIALFLEFVSLILSVALIILSLKPSFKNVKVSSKAIWEETKSYGIHFFLSRAIGTSSFRLDNIFISYFLNTKWVGFYRLAFTLVSPIALLSRSMFISLFKDFTKQDKIPRKFIYYNLVWLVSATTIFIILRRFIVTKMFTEKYLSVVPLTLPLALTSFFQGMYQPYNIFLSAKGKGKWLRNMSVISAIINILFFYLFIKLLGVLGAAIAHLVVNFIWYMQCLFYYRKFHEEIC